MRDPWLPLRRALRVGAAAHMRGFSQRQRTTCACMRGKRRKASHFVIAVQVLAWNALLFSPMASPQYDRSRAKPVTWHHNANSLKPFPHTKRACVGFWNYTPPALCAQQPRAGSAFWNVHWNLSSD